MPWAVSNSSPLIGLSRVGRLEVLPALYDPVWIPPAVQREVVSAGQSRAGSPEVAAAIAAGWLQVVEPSDAALLARLRIDLDPGESEAIALALTTRPDVLVIDENKGRKIAADYGLVITGTVGLLTKAAREGIIDTLQADLNRLRQAGFRISDRLYQQALRASRPDTN